MPNPKEYPVLTATLLAPVVAYLGGKLGLDLDDAQAAWLAGAVLAAGSTIATNLVRSRRTLPDPDATKDNTAVALASRGRAVAEPTRYTPPTKPPLRSRVRPPAEEPPRE